MKNPKVSIIMSVFNGQDHIKECIDSILSQTLTDFEFIIINDGSDDQTAERLKEYSDPRIRTVEQENSGLTKSLNRAVNLSGGKYIARIDADETAMPNRLAAQVDFLNTHPDVGLVGSFYINTDSDGRLLHKIETPVSDGDIRMRLRIANAIGHGSVMIRKDVFRTVGLYNEDLKYVQDFELWGRIAKSFKVHNLPEYLLKRKVTDASLSSKKEIMIERSRCALKAHISTLKNLGIPFYRYYYLWPSLLMYWAYRLRIIKSPIKQKSSLIEIITQR